ncbi:MAG: hypothetical protein Q9212_002448 [Teloschistes hypoglaucus]
MSFSSRKTGPKQTRLSLTPLPSSSPAASGLNQQVQNRAAAVRFGADGSPTKKRRVVLSQSSGQTRLDYGPIESSRTSADADATLLPTPIPSSQSIGKKEGSRWKFESLDPEPNQPSNPSSSSDEEDAIVDPRTRSSRRVRPSKDKESFSDATRKRNQKSNPPEEAHESTGIKRGQQSLVKAGKRFITGGPTGAAPINSLRETYIATPTRSSKRMPASKQRRHSPPDESPSLSRRSSQESDAESDDSADSLMNDLKKSATKSRKPPRDQEITSGNPIEVSRFKKEQSRRTRSPSTGEPEASESGSHSEEHQNTRQTGRGARTREKRHNIKELTRKKHLELYQERRAGKGEVPVSDDLDIVSPNEDSQVAETHSECSSDADEREFVVEDDDDTVGAPAALDEMPIQFTRHARKKSVEHFRDVVEWMIHNRLNRAFDRHNEVYGIATQKLDQRAQALVGSKFMSATWSAEFSRALKEYPELESIAMNVSLDDQKCEACNRSGHPAKHRLIFSGKPYDRKSLESEFVSSDEESDDTGQPSPGKTIKTVFLLGSHCNANAQTAHALQHWRHALNDDVQEYLRTNGHLKDTKIVQREAWSAKKKEKNANEVVEEMEADGWMHRRHKEFKDNMNAATNATDGNSRRRH